MVYIRKFLSYAITFMIGYYIGSGGCIDRMLGVEQSRLERMVDNSYAYEKFREDSYEKKP